MNITVIGIGNLGLCTALCFARSGFNTLGIDKFPDYVKSLNEGIYKSYEPGVNELLQNTDNFRASTDVEEGLLHADIIFILVQTPNGGGDKFYDHSILSDLLLKINKFKPENKHFVISSTVMPKYIDTVAKCLLSDCKNCTVNYNPEFIAQGSIIHDFLNPDIILIGEETEKSGDLIQYIHRSITEGKPKICRMSCLEAEITKISLNGFLTTKITYANLIGDFCIQHGFNPDKVLGAIKSDSRVGSKCFNYGYSVGGPCLYRDTSALQKCISDADIDSILISAVKTTNDDHVKFQANLNNEDNIVFTDVCYKENSKIPIITESAKLKIAKILALKGKKVTIIDEQQIINEVKKEYGNIFKYQIK